MKRTFITFRPWVTIPTEEISMTVILPDVVGGVCVCVFLGSP